jgi:hypothetical protein
MEKIILGVHGLGNKPPKELLEEWWQQSIAEGLRRIGHPRKKFNFELVYWADSLHPVPLDPEETEEDNELYLSERYIPARKRKRRKPKGFKEKIINFFKKQRDKILFNESIHKKFPSLTDLIVKHFFKDLDIYFTQNCTEENKSDCLVKDLIRDNIFNTIKKHDGKEILLIAHSMGSIILYEVLINFENDITINSLITIGSPIGVPFIFDKLKNDLSTVPGDKNKLRTPDNIESKWANLSDTDDKLAQSADLCKIFKVNSHNVSPAMELVDNDYESEGIENPHKSFGYLRTPELAQIVDDFLCRGKNKFIYWLTKKFDQLIYKLAG